MLQRMIIRLRYEAASLLSAPWHALRTDGLSAFPLTLASTALVGLFAVIQHSALGCWVVEHVADVYQALPLPLILLRLPLSMFAPAPDLPAWGAMLQTLAVIGLSETHLGRLRTLVTAVCVNGLTTVSASLMMLAAHHLSIGSPQLDRYEPDTGPSTVVVALSVCVALTRRAYAVLTVTAAAMAAEATALPNLAGREHLVALALGAASYLLGPSPSVPISPAPPVATASSPRPPAQDEVRPRRGSRP